MPKNTNTKKSTKQNKKVHEHYKKLYKNLKPFVDFKVDLRKPLTKSEKSTITRYTKELDRLTKNKPYALQIYRSNNRTRLNKVKEMGGQDKRLTKFKVAFVPKTSKHQKIKFNKKGEAYTVGVHVKATFIPLDPIMLATEQTEEYINDIVQNRTERSFSIQAGDYEISGTFSKTVIASAVNKLAMRYNNEEENNYFGNWLGGIFANEFQNQGDLDAYRSAKRTAQIKKDRSARKKEKNKSIKLFYWYDRKAETVLLTKTDSPPNKSCEAITRREYERFLKIGEV